MEYMRNNYFNEIMDVILPGLETPIDLPIIVIRSLPR